MIRSYKFRMYPTSKQDALLRAMLDDHRSLYNAALQERRDAWKRGKQIWFADQDAQLTAIRAEDKDQARWSYSAQEQTLRRLDKAFKAFFRRVRDGRAPGYPRFKGIGYFDTVDHRNGDGAKWDSHPTQTKVYFQGVGHIKVRQHRPVVARRLTRIGIKREGRRWYVILAADQALPAALQMTGVMVGIDLATGPNGLAYTSVGERIENPAYGRASQSRLADADRMLSRTQRGSNRRRKARQRLADVHRKIRNQRHDYLHKAARRLVDRYDVIVAEDLNIAGMTRRAAPRPDGARGYEHNGGSAKTGLNRSIHDAGWGLFLEMIRAKAESAGREFIQVDPAYTSQSCSKCGHREAANRNGKFFRCLSCGHVDDADVNAAVNILKAGLALRDVAETAPREAHFIGMTSLEAGRVPSG